MIAGRTDLPVLLPFRPGARSAGARRPGRGHALALVSGLVLSIGIGDALAAPGVPSILATLVKWTPLLATGFLLNIAISFIAMAIGTALGTLLGLMQISLFPPGARLLLGDDAVLPQRALARALVLLHAAPALRDADRASDRAAAGLAQGDLRPVARR